MRQVVGLRVVDRRPLIDDTKLHRLAVLSPVKRDKVKLLCGWKLVFKGFVKTLRASPLKRDRRSVVKLDIERFENLLLQTLQKFRA